MDDTESPTAINAAEFNSWTFVASAKRLERLQATRVQSGHNRMLGAIATEQASSTATVLTAGSAEDKARAVFDYLKQHSLLSP